MYKGHYEVLLGEEEVSKIEEMLREKWNAKEIVISKFKNGWKITFLTDDRKKIFRLLWIIRQYGGEVVDHWIEKLDAHKNKGCD